MRSNLEADRIMQQQYEDESIVDMSGRSQITDEQAMRWFERGMQRMDRETRDEIVFARLEVLWYWFTETSGVEPKEIKNMNRRHRIINIDTDEDESDYESSATDSFGTDSSMQESNSTEDRV